MGLAPYFQYNYASSTDKPCVPLVTENTVDFANNPRTTAKEIYTQILQNLTSAIELLSDYNRKDDKGRINQQVASALRARAHLYMGNWAEAA